MIDRLARVKRHPFYVEWHFELGILLLFIGLTMVAVGVGLAIEQNATQRAELSRHDQEIARQAHEGEQAHVALCAQRDSVKSALQRNLQYLRLTPAERVSKLGIPPQFANVPDTFIHQSISGERRTLRAYRGLRCRAS